MTHFTNSFALIETLRRASGRGERNAQADVPSTHPYSETHGLSLSFSLSIFLSHAHTYIQNAMQSHAQ